MKRARSPLPAKRAIVGTGIAAIFIGALATTAAPAAVAATTTFNPFSINNGFTVVAQGDAHLNNGEIEGTLAAFGSLSSGNQNGYPVVHQVAGIGDYTVPTIDDQPVRLLAQQYVGSGSFDITNRSAPAQSPESAATAKFASIDGLTGSARGGGNAGGDFLRVTNAENGNLDLKAVPFTNSDVSGLETEESTVSAYFANTADHIAATSACFTSMYDTALALSNVVTVEDQGGMVFPQRFATDMPNVISYDAIAGKTIKLDRADGYTPTAAAPLVVRVPAGATTIGKLTFEGWSAGAGEQQSYARYILLDMSDVTGPVTIDGFEMGAIWAPAASLNFNSGTTTNGQWFSQDVTTNGGGELHHHSFLGQLPCAVDDESESADAEADADAEAGVGADAGVEADADASAEGTSEAEGDAEIEADADTDTDGTSEAEGDAKIEADAEASVDVDADAETAADGTSESDGATNVAANADADSNGTSEAEGDAGVEASATAASAAGAEGAATAAANTDADAAAAAGAEGSSESEATATSTADADGTTEAESDATAEGTVATDGDNESDSAATSESGASATATANADTGATASGATTGAGGSAPLAHTGTTTPWLLFAFGGLMVVGGMALARRRHA